jgi:hypothetical protein
MLDRMHELFTEFRDEYGILTARKMAKEHCLEEMMVDLTELELTTEEKIDRVITVLELMNMKVD